MENRVSIGVCVVTYNRLEKLKIALRLFDSQIKQPLYMIVVDNASTDGTKEYLDKWKTQIHGYEAIVISTNYNMGGSGGFYTGLMEALQRNANWIWLSDDDAYPEEDALEKASLFIEDAERSDLYSAICGEVICEGAVDVSHRRNIYTRGLEIVNDYIPEILYRERCFMINSFSYVGAIVNRNSLILAGVTKKDYFIHNDDTEHSLRLSKVGKIMCVPSIKIHHDATYDEGGGLENILRSSELY